MYTLVVRRYFDRLTKEGIASKKICGVTSHDKILTILSNVDKEGIWSQVFRWRRNVLGIIAFWNHASQDFWLMYTWTKTDSSP